jgi:hypothetical protein
MKHPPRVNGLAVATLVLLGAASVGYAASPAAVATGPTVTVQVNDAQRSIDGGIVQLGTTPVVVAGSANGELSKIECSGLSPGELPADSVGAALLALGEEWTIEGLHGGGTLTFAGEELPMQSISYRNPAPGEYEEGWQLWVEVRYYDLGSGAVLGLCATLQEGETVLLQSSELVATSAPSAPAPYSTDTPHIQIEGVPTSVVVGQRFTVTVAAFQPERTGRELLELLPDLANDRSRVQRLAQRMPSAQRTQTVPSPTSAPSVSRHGQAVGTVYRLGNGQLVYVQKQR